MKKQNFQNTHKKGSVWIFIRQQLYMTHFNCHIPHYKTDRCQAVGRAFHPYDDWFSSSYIHHFSLKMGVLWTRLKFVPLAVLYLLAIMEMRTIVKTMVPAIPPIDIPRMFPWTCLDWHLSPVKKKACPDGHLGKQSTDSVDQEPGHASPQGPHTHYPRWAVPIAGVHVTTFLPC